MHEIKWRRSVSCDKGVIVATDARQEWMLPWWWKHYSKCNPFPVTFVDCGISDKAKQWCKERGELVSLHIDFATWQEKEQMNPDIIALWEKRSGTGFWASRKGWFYKPQALLLSPYQTTLWLDLDCQVRSNLSPLFDTTDIALCASPPYSTAFDLKHGIILDGEEIFNSGVIACRHNHPLISQWAQEVPARAHMFWTDQHLLSRIIFEQNYPIEHLSLLYNWHMALGINRNAHIIHLLGDAGKEVIALECRGML